MNDGSAESRVCLFFRKISHKNTVLRRYGDLLLMA